MTLARLHIARDGQAVDGIPAGDHRAAGLRHLSRQFAIHPHFGIVVDGGFKFDARARRIEIPDAGRHLDGNPVPVEGEAAVAAARRESACRNRRPSGIVEVSDACVRFEIPSRLPVAGGLALCIGTAMAGRNELHVRVAPRGVDHRSAFRRR